MALTEQLIRDTYRKLKDKANYYLSKGNIQKGELYTHLAAYTNYTFWLSYYDGEMEQLLKKASNSIHQRNDVKIISGHRVLLDSLSRFRGGLTVQYVKAIMAAGWELLYITEQEMTAPHHVELYEFLKSYGNITVIEIPKALKGEKKLQFVYDKIIDYGAERVYVHSASSNALFPTISYALPNEIENFYVDMADHGFRMGMDSCDYVFQFRTLGCSIAIKERGVAPERILYLPFYPMMDDKEYQGLPKECDGKVVVLSGGIFWKIVDQEDTFFKLCKQLLEQNPQAIIVYPGGGDATYVQNKLKEYCIEDRFLLLGWRDDISELFRHCDLFLNTYPHGGGTMSLYAAHLKKPILSFEPDEMRPNPIEKFVCQKKSCMVSSIGQEEFLTEAKRLIENKSYREEKAEKSYYCVMPEDAFNAYFKEMSLSHKNQIAFSIKDELGETDKLRKKKIDYHNKQGEYQMRLVALCGLNTMTLRKEFLKPFILKIGPKMKRVFEKRGFHFNRV